MTDYVEVEVTEGAAKLGKIIIVSGALIGVFLMIFGFANDNAVLASIGLGVMMLGIIIYGFIALGSSVVKDMGQSEAFRRGLLILGAIVGSLGFLFLLLALLGVF